jgi:hypothetical protein
VAGHLRRTAAHLPAARVALELERKRDFEQRPGAGRALDPDRPAEGLDAIVQADESRALAGIRSADAVVADRQQQDAVALRERNVDP